MRRTDELERRLIEWGREYPDVKTEYLGYPSKSPSYSAIIYQGPSPQGLNPRGVRDMSPADEVECSVAFLERQRDGYHAAKCLRAEYRGKENDSVEDRIRALRKIGVMVSRTRYFDNLWIARTHVASWLRIPASVELPADVA